MVMVTVSFNIKTMKKICGRIQGQENVETDNTFFFSFSNSYPDINPLMKMEEALYFWGQ